MLNKFVLGKSSRFSLANLCFAGVPNKEPKMDRSKKYFSSSIYYFIIFFLVNYTLICESNGKFPPPFFF